MTTTSTPRPSKARKADAPADAPAPALAVQSDEQVHSTIDELVANATKALAEFASMTQDDVDRFVKKGAVAALDQHGQLAKLAVEETGRGVFEDKAVKNIFACEHVTNSMANLKTVGVIHVDELNGITEIAEPVGVIAGITPVTNPTSTAIFKSLISLKTATRSSSRSTRTRSSPRSPPRASCATRQSPRAPPSTASSGSRPRRSPRRAC